MVAVHERSYCCSLQGGAMMGCRRLGRENGGGGSDSRQMADARTGSAVDHSSKDSCLSLTHSTVQGTGVQNYYKYNTTFNIFFYYFQYDLSFKGRTNG